MHPKSLAAETLFAGAFCVIAARPRSQLIPLRLTEVAVAKQTAFMPPSGVRTTSWQVFKIPGVRKIE